MKKAIFLAFIAVIPGIAAASKPVDNYVSTLIEGRDYGAAEDALSARLVRAHDDARSLLNLAFLYQATDRWDQADAAYARVMAAPDMQVATNTGQIMSSHDIARSALNRATVTVASR